MKTLYVIPLAAKGFVPTHPEHNPVRFYAVDELERLITGGYETPGEAVRAGLAVYPDATFPDEPEE